VSNDGATPIYDAAKTALRQCAEVDECKSWNIDAAIGSYANQCDDDTLMRLTVKIQRRAVRERDKLARELVTVLHYWDDPVACKLLGLNKTRWPHAKPELEELLATVIAEGSA
jgi:hypothetical protein